jgi:cell division protein FtsB
MSGQRRPADPRASKTRAPAKTPASARRTTAPKVSVEPTPATVTVPTRSYRGTASTRLTGRAALLFLVLTGLALTLAWPARQYVDQRRQIASLRSQTQVTKDRVALLQQQVQQWGDPQYVEAEARQRLHFRLPGETAYVVLRPHHRGAATPPKALTTAPTKAWYSSMWDSVEQASQKS